MLGYYAVFFYDPDGIKLEIVHVPTTRSLKGAPWTADTQHADERRPLPIPGNAELVYSGRRRDRSR